MAVKPRNQMVTLSEDTRKQPAVTGGKQNLPALPVQKGQVSTESAMKKNTAGEANASPAATQKAVYYSRPELGQLTERLYNDAKNAEMRLQEVYDRYNTAHKELEEVQAGVESWKKQMAIIQTNYQKDPSAQNAQYLEKAQKYMWQLLKSYNKKKNTFDSAYADFEPAKTRYGQSVNVYNNYIQNQQEQLNAWKDTIRDTGTIQADMDAMDSQIRELEAEIGRLNTLTRGRNDQLGQHMRQSMAQSQAQLEQLQQSRAMLQEEYDWSRLSSIGDIDSMEPFGSLSADDRLMTMDLLELQSWDREDVKTLETYIMQSNDEFWSDKRDLMPTLQNAEAAVIPLYAKYGEGKVKEMAESLRRYQNIQNTEAMTQAAQQGVSGDGFWERLGKGGLHSILSVGANLLNAASGPMGYMQEVGNRTGRYSTLDPNNVGNAMGQYAGTVRGRVAQNISGDQYDEDGRKIKDGGILRQAGVELYGAGMSAADSFARMLLGGGNKFITKGLAATGSFGSTVSQMSSQGASPEQAIKMGLINGGLEILTEEYSLDRLLNMASSGKQSIKQILKNMLVQGAVEVSEEEMSFLGSTLAEALVMREKSGYNQRIQELVNQGNSREQAKEIANRELWQEAGHTALQSFLSGSMMAGGTSIVTNGKYSQLEKLEKKLNQPKESMVLGEDESEGLHLPYPNVRVETEDRVRQNVLEQASRIARATGRDVVFYSADRTENGIENGYYEDGTIYINARSEDALSQIVSHELTHSVEFADAYQDLSRTVFRQLESMGANLQNLRKQKANLYAQNGHALKDTAAVDKEIVADFVGQYLLADEKTILSVTAQNRTLGQKIKNWLDGLLAKLGNSKAQERVFLTNARDIWAKALEQTKQAAPVAGNAGTEQGLQETQKAAPEASTYEDTSGEEVIDWNDPDAIRKYGDELLSRGEINDEEHAWYMDMADQAEIEADASFSFAGVNAKNANFQTLGTAQEMERLGVANETIRQQTGWFKGMDGKWRFEVDDSQMQYYRGGDAMFSEMHPEYARHQELMKKFLYGELSGEEETEFRELDAIWGSEHQRLSDRVKWGNAQLQNIIRHDELFEAYPELRGAKVVFEELPEGTRGQYDPSRNVITIRNSLRNAPEDTLIHEIQHAIQNIEGFSMGASTEYWDGQQVAKPEYASEVKAAAENVKKVEAEFHQEWSDDINLNLVKQYIELDNQLWKDETDPSVQKELAEQMEQIEQAASESGWGDLFNDYYYAVGKLQLAKERAKLHRRTSTDLYRNTAGEIEARDVTARRRMNAEDRKNTPPNLGDEDTVFAEDTGISFDMELSEYPYNMQTVIQDYLDAVDQNVLSFVEEVQSGQAWKGKKLTVGTATSRMVKDIASLTGVQNMEGCKILMNTNAVEHIQRRHGENGEHDSTMSNNKDIARINYVLQNYDSMELSPRVSGEYKNRDSSRAQMVVLSKKINGTYFVIEAVPDTGKIGIVSAYMNKKRASQVPDDNTPGRNVHDELASALNNNLADDNDSVKQFSISAADKRGIAGDLRSILNRGGSTMELRQYIEHLERGGGFSERTRGRVYHTGGFEERNETQRIIREAKRQGIGVEEYLRQNWEQYETDGKWNAAARAALDQERQGRRYSISGTGEDIAEKKTAQQIREEMPAKARNYLDGAERRLLTGLGDKLGVSKFQNRDVLQQIVREISDEYLENGIVPSEKLDFLFDKGFAEGIVEDATFYDQYKEIKRHLQTTGVSLSKQDQADIADFNDFRRRAWGTVKIVNDGLPVDSAYHELHEMAPNLFPESITHPADQLVRMYEVGQSIRVAEVNLQHFHGRDADIFRQDAKNQFGETINSHLADLRTVRRVAEEDAEKTAEKSEVPVTPEEAAEAYHHMKDARKTYEKAIAKNLLSDRDEMQVGRLLKGEILPEHLDPDKDNVRSITAVYEAKKEYERLTKLIAEYKKNIRAERLKKADALLETANEWKDKKVGLAYSRETMERNIYDIVPDRTVAEKVNREIFHPVHTAEAKATRFKNDYRDRVRGLDLSRKIQKGNLVSEAHAVQLLGEAEDNIRVLQASKGRMKQRDGKTLEEWQSVVDELWRQSPGLNEGKIRRAVAEFRKIYDELFQQMNAVRVRNGYEPVNYRQGYFPHFQPGDGDGVLSHFGKVLGIDTQVAALPTTINGLTHTFRPGIQWFGNAQERLGFNTAYDAVEGFDKYIEGVASVIHQTDNIQMLRAMESQIRYRTTDDGIRKQVDAVNADSRLTEEEKRVKINDIYEHGKYTLSNFVTELTEYTNLLANKKSRLDRTMEGLFGRKAYTVVKAWESRVGANMIAGNISSALTNFIPLTQAGAQLSSDSMLKGIWNTLKAYKVDDGIPGMSTFLTNRRGSDPLIKVWENDYGFTELMADSLLPPKITSKKGYGAVKRVLKKAYKPAKPLVGWTSEKANFLMELIDGFTSDTILRAAYYNNLKQGMSETEALYQADLFAASVMADRSKGAMPTLFESTNPLFKMFTQFQLEVNNQYSEVFKDLPRRHKQKGLLVMAGVLFKYFLGAYLFNDLYEYFAGRRPALDPFGMLNDTVGDLTGYELPNTVDWISGKDVDFTTEKVGVGETAKNLASSALGELPFSSGLTFLGIETDGGRIPASSAVPDLTALLVAATQEDWAPEKRWKEAQDELNKLAYIIPPFGGNQVQKIWKGIKAFREGGSYTVDKEGNDILQYPVYKDDPMEAFANALRMMVMGKNSLETAQDWVASGFDSLGKDQTAVYQDMVDTGASDRDSYELLKELQKVQKTDEESKLEIQREILRGADVPDDAKAVVYYGLLASESDCELMDYLTDTGADPYEVAKVLMAISDAGKQLKGAEASCTKRDAIAAANLTDDEKEVIYREKISESRDDDIAQLRAAGLDFNEFLEIHNQYVRISERDLKASEKATDFARWVDGQKYTDKQAEVIKDCFAYYSQMPVSASGYEKMVDSGLDPDDAYELANALEDLEPEDGEDKVTNVQRWRECIKFSDNIGIQLAALRGVADDKQYAKIQMAYDYGVNPDSYVGLQEIKSQHDADGNGSFTNDEMKAAVDSLPGLSTEQKAVLWQLATGNTSAKNNPYSREVGQKIVDARAAAKEGSK